MGALRPIVPILINSGGVSISVYALLDTGATKSAILTDFVYKIGGKIREKTCKISTFGQRTETTLEFTDFIVQPLDKSFEIIVKDAVVGDILTTERDIPLTNKDLVGHSYLEDVDLLELKDKTVGVILDVQFFGKWENWRVGLEDQPIAFKSKFGWAVMGPPLKQNNPGSLDLEELALNPLELALYEEILGTSFEQKKPDIEICAYDSQELTLLQEINSMFRHDFIMGRNEVFSHEHIHPSQEDEYSENQLIESTDFNQEMGRYDVGLPYAHGREDSAKILNSVNSYANAEKRLWSMKKKLEKDEVLKAGVFEQIQRSIKEGHIKVVDDSKLPENQAEYYMPVLVALHPDKPGKFRVCQDAAAKVKGVCLNGQLLKGPDYLNNMNGILFRFRKGKVCYSADIKDFFYRIGVDSRDEGCFRFLFFRDEKMDEIIKLQGNVHLFGLSSSPVVSAFTLRHHANENKDIISPEIFRAMMEQFYVDDLIDSVDNVPDARRNRIELTKVMKRGNFDLCKWQSNFPEVLFDSDLEFQNSLDTHQVEHEDVKVVLTDAKSDSEEPHLDNISPINDTVSNQETVEDQTTSEDANFVEMAFSKGDNDEIFLDEFNQIFETLDIVNKILGIGYSFDSDKFFIRIKPKHGKEVGTRRQMLSLVASVYDPLGFVSPFIFKGRETLQKSIMEELTWDCKLTEELQKNIDHWRQTMIELRKIEIPRWTSMLGLEDCESRLIIFCDASFDGYGMVAYIRRSLIGGSNAFVIIIYSKSHVVPINMQKDIMKNQEDHGDSIPRLELTAARLAATSRDMIVKESGEVFDKIHHFTDSITVLKWLNDWKKKFKTFENFRLKKIRLLTDTKNEWAHCPSKLNAADACSHGIDANDHEKFQMFLSGPAFLKDAVETWPPPRPDLETEALAKSEQVSPNDLSGFAPIELIQINATQIQVSEKELKGEDWRTSITKNKSEWETKIRVIAQMENFLMNWKRFLDLRKKGVSEKFVKERLNLAKLHKAEMNLVKVIQFDHFGKEITKLLLLGVNSPNAHKELRSKISRLNSLSPFLDENNVLRAGGRLGKSSFLMYDTKYPKILPKNCSQVKALIRHCHRQNAHSSRLQTYHLLRQHYLLLGGRPEVNGVISTCIKCQRLEKRPIPQRQADLPSQRLDIRIPFAAVGIDCFGPYHVRFGGRGTTKRWVLLVTDMVTRAICLTALTDMTSDSLKNALVRIHSQYPVLRQVFCDNGTNFTGGARELKEAFEKWGSEQTRNQLLSKGIEFHFGPPNCGSAGGVWESMVKLCKKHVKVLVNNDDITDTVFSTILCEVSAIMNRRPITYATNDIDDPQALSPINLLFPYAAISSSCSTLPPTPLSGDEARKQWNLMRRIVEEFWKRFSEEYLSTLRKRTKWLNSEKAPYIGQLVLMCDSQLPRENWPLAIVETQLSEDKKHLRRFLVRTASGAKFERHITHLVSLEMDTDESC